MAHPFYPSGNPRFNHVAMSLPADMLGADSRVDICRFFHEVLGFDEIKVCVGYHLDGERIESLPAGQNAQARVKAIYETLEGWTESTRGARRWAQLPAQAVKYVRHIEELIECPVTLLSTSPEREDTILMKDRFED